MQGATVCRTHGGSAPQVKAAAERRLAMADAAATVLRIGPHRLVADPLTALADVAGEVTAVKDFLRGLVDQLIEREGAQAGAVDMSSEVLGRREQLRMPDDKGAEQLNAKFQAYMAMLNTTVGTLATIAKLNIEERLARIEEAKKQMMIEALRRAWAEMGISGEAQTRGMATFARHLRVVGSEEGKRAA